MLRFALPLTLCLAACAAPSAPEPPAPVRSPTVEIPVAAALRPVQPTGDWIDWPLAAGDWAYMPHPTRPYARFGPANGNAVVLLTCDRSRGKLSISRGNADGDRLTVRTSSTLRELQVDPEAVGISAFALTPSDPLLDAIALSRGRFALEMPGHQNIAVPAWAEITRIVEDCRG